MKNAASDAVTIIIFLGLVPYTAIAGPSAVSDPLDTNEQRYTKEALNNLAKHNLPALVSECSSGFGKVTLLLPVGSGDAGLFFETELGKINNVTEVTIVDGSIKQGEINGGEFSMLRVTFEIQELANGEFYYLDPKNLTQVLSSEPKKLCSFDEQTIFKMYEKNKK